MEVLAEAVKRVDVRGYGADIVAVLGLIDSLYAKVVSAVGEFDRSGEWETDGYASAIAWLRVKARLSGGNAASLVRIAKRLRELPVTESAWASGELSRDQVAAVMANVDDDTAEMFSDQEAEIIPVLVNCTVAQTASAMRLWRQRAEALCEEPEDAEPVRHLHVSKTFAGRAEIAGSLDPESGEIVATAVRLATSNDVEGEPVRSSATRRADALVDICRRYLNQRDSGSGVGRNRPHLNVVVDFKDMDSEGPGQVLEGTTLDGSTIRRLLCDAGVHRVITSGKSSVLDYGTTTQAIPAPLWAPLVIRDHHCRFPGCDRPPQWCEGHHIVHWADGGSTDLSNLVVICSRHHHLLHRRRWSAELQPNGDFVVTTTDGRVLRSSLADAPPLFLAG